MRRGTCGAIYVLHTRSPCFAEVHGGMVEMTGYHGSASTKAA